MRAVRRPCALRVLGEEAVGLLLDEAHVAAVPGGRGPQHVLPPQHQGGQTLLLQLTHHRQQLHRAGDTTTNTPVNATRLEPTQHIR